MNENDFLRKDVYDADKDHMIDLIAELHRRIDDLQDSFNRMMTFAGMFIAVLSVVLPVIVSYLR